MGAAADAEIQVLTLDPERRARQGADVRVPLAHVLAGAGVVAVDQALALLRNCALVSRHLHRANRAVAEGGSGDGPRTVVLALEILDRQVRAVAGLDRRLLGGAVEQGAASEALDSVAQHRLRPSAVVMEDRVLQEAGEPEADRSRPRIADFEAQHGGGPARLRRPQGDEGRAGLQVDLQRETRTPVVDPADGVLAGEADLLPPGAVEDPGGIGRREREAELEGRGRLHRLDVVGAVLRAHRLPQVVDGLALHSDVRVVEDVPQPQPAVTAQVDRAGADAADRHADPAQLAARVDRLFAARGQRVEPRLRQLLVRRDRAVLRRERAGEGRQAVGGEGAGGRRCGEESAA